MKDESLEDLLKQTKLKGHSSLRDRVLQNAKDSWDEKDLESSLGKTKLAGNADRLREVCLSSAHRAWYQPNVWEIILPHAFKLAAVLLISVCGFIYDSRQNEHLKVYVAAVKEMPRQTMIVAEKSNQGKEKKVYVVNSKWLAVFKRPEKVKTSGPYLLFNLNRSKIHELN